MGNVSSLDSFILSCFFWGLGSRGDRLPESIATLCDAFRDELEKRDLTKYVNSILTAHVVKTPPDHEAGLALLLRLRGKSNFILLISESFS